MVRQSTKLTYTANGYYFTPDIAFSVAASNNLGKYGRMRKKYLQEHRPGLFNRLVLSENSMSIVPKSPPPEAALTLCSSG